MRPTGRKILTTRHIRKVLDEEHPHYIQPKLQKLLSPDLLTMGFARMKRLSYKFTKQADIYQDTLRQVANITKTCKLSKVSWEAFAICGSIFDTPFPIKTKKSPISPAKTYSQIANSLTQMNQNHPTTQFNSTFCKMH